MKEERTFDVYFLIQEVLVFQKGEKELEEVAKELADHYKEPIEKYIKLLADSIEQSEIIEDVNKVLEKKEVLNKEEFNAFINSKIEELYQHIHDFILNNETKEEFLHYVLNKDMLYELLRQSGVNMVDVEVVYMACLEQEYDMLAYAALCEIYKIFMNELEDADLIHSNRIRIEKECKEITRQIIEYRDQLEEVVSTYLTSNLDTFTSAIDTLDQAILNKDVDGYLKGNVMIQMALGYDVQFSDVEEFEKLMESDMDFIF